MRQPPEVILAFRHRNRTVAFALMSICIAGNALIAQEDDRPAELAARAERYWKAREERDLIAAYPFYCSDYKKRVPLSEFVKQTRLARFELKNIKITEISRRGQLFDVTITYQFMAPMLTDRPLESRVTDVWTKDSDGLWCKQDEPATLPFPSGR
jgi:hypothetical protein